MPKRVDLLASLLPVARELRGIEDAASAAHGVTMWRYAILATAIAAPGRNQRELATLLDYSQNRLIADVDALERQGLLERRPGEDRRANVLEVTDAGREIVAAVEADIHAGEDALLEPFDDAERATFGELALRLGRHAAARRRARKR